MASQNQTAFADRSTRLGVMGHLPVSDHPTYLTYLTYSTH